MESFSPKQIKKAQREADLVSQMNVHKQKAKEYQEKVDYALPDETDEDIRRHVNLARGHRRLAKMFQDQLKGSATDASQ
jgi:hypothetical protein